MIVTNNGQPSTACAVHVRARLGPCLILCLAMLSGCERNQPPKPGPKPISGSTPATSAAPPAPATNGASGVQAAPR